MKSGEHSYRHLAMILHEIVENAKCGNVKLGCYCVYNYGSSNKRYVISGKQGIVFYKVLSPTRKETSYSDQTLTFASHSKKIQKVVHPTRSLRQQ
jgi:hypothetical protein